MRLRSLRWRIATLYALLLLGAIAVVAIVLVVELRTILLDEARAKVDLVGTDIAALARNTSILGGFGEALPIEQQLTMTETLDHWSGPTTFVEIATPAGYPIGKSSNMGGAAFARPSEPRTHALNYRTEHVPLLGDVFIRDELVRYPGLTLNVEVAESLAIYDETLRRVRTLIAIVLLLAALVVGAGSFAIASSAVEPIGRLIAAMREIRSDRLSRRLGWSDRRDELGLLAQAFDDMLERLEEGFARERQFISDASHELKTPLTVINANAQMLERWADREPVVRAESLRAIREESGELAAMINGMLVLAKAESGDDLPRRPVALEDVLAEAVRAARPRAEAKGITAELHASTGRGGIEVLGDANLLRQLFSNLVDNAVKFTEHGGVDVDVEAAADDPWVRVTVADTGSGIAEAELERVFDRFYRADASRNRAVPGT
ncbi:MAG: HAMP domain-containing histidine kinase, partial [Candidatus Eremiobacteraeota bacterium]|nr:HAMP domain-containing histidine kinase [Candidatus Eremiobacteraeota bacterium]